VFRSAARIVQLRDPICARYPYEGFGEDVRRPGRPDGIDGLIGPAFPLRDPLGRGRIVVDRAEPAGTL
jgi:hypothetical protein